MMNFFKLHKLIRRQTKVSFIVKTGTTYDTHAKFKMSFETLEVLWNKSYAKATGLGCFETTVNFEVYYFLNEETNGVWLILW